MTVRGGETCSIARAVDVVGETWSFLILREALRGTTRFAEFRSALAIGPDVLSARLDRLVEAGVMTREPYREPGRRERFEYLLTPAGQDLIVVIGALQQWGDDHLPHPGGATVERRSHRSGRPLRIDFVDDRGRAVGRDDVEMVRTASYPSSGPTKSSSSSGA